MKIFYPSNKLETLQAWRFGPKFHLFPRDSGKDAGRGHIQNCPRAIDCEAVEARGQFWICPRTASFPDPEEKGGILTLLTSFPTLVPFRREAFQVSKTMAFWEYCFYRAIRKTRAQLTSSLHLLHNLWQMFCINSGVSQGPANMKNQVRRSGLVAPSLARYEKLLFYYEKSWILADLSLFDKVNLK